MMTNSEMILFCVCVCVCVHERKRAAKGLVSDSVPQLQLQSSLSQTCSQTPVHFWGIRQIDTDKIGSYFVKL